MKSGVKEIVQRINTLFRERGLTLSVAESCTGGLISHYITSIPGASLFFKAGVVSYCEETKKNILNVSGETVRKHGVVSTEVAIEMACNMRALSKTDFSLSSTGNLGPDALEGKEIGLVYIAACGESGAACKKLRLHRERDENREDAAVAAVRFLAELVEGL